MPVSYSIEYYHRKILSEIEGWPAGVYADYLRITELVAESGPNVGMPHSRSMGGGLFELRPRSGEGVGRSLYCYCRGRRVIVLHAFIKKSRAAPRRDLELARRRMGEVRRG